MPASWAPAAPAIVRLQSLMPIVVPSDEILLPSWFGMDPGNDQGDLTVISRGDHQRLQEVLNNAMRDAAELTAMPRIAIDPAWPGGDHAAMVAWHLDRGRVTIIDDVRIWPVMPIAPLLA